MNIKKIYTQVTDGRFQVDMEFTGDIPKGIRADKPCKSALALSDQTQLYYCQEVVSISRLVVTGFIN
jgi:hypothetical protein